jgi:hypothetical protein
VPSPAAEFPKGTEVAERFDVYIDRQLDLCLGLESLADSLPARVDTHAAMILSERLEVTLQRSHEFEELSIFPILRISNRDLGATLDRLRDEHFEDEGHAADLREAVRAYVSHRSSGRPEEMGYILRGLFTSLHRHLAFDREFVLPLYRKNCGL